MANLKEMAKMVRKLNKLELTDEPVDTKQDDADALQEDFISAIEEIDDAGKIDEVDDAIIDYYESLIDDGGDKGKGEGKGKKAEPEFDEMDEDELAEFCDDNDLKLTKKDKKLTEKKLRKVVIGLWEESQGDGGDKGGDGDAIDFATVDTDDLQEKLEDMDKDELKEFLEANEIEIDTKVTKKNLDDCVEEAMEEVESLVKKAKKAAKKDKKGGKEKKEKKSGKKDKDKGEKLPKGIRSGTLPATVYEEIADGGSTLGKIAKKVAKAKKKDPEQVYGLTMRTVVRKVSSAVKIIATMTGSEEDILFELAEDND